jgi:hypothetical protein
MAPSRPWLRRRWACLSWKAPFISPAILRPFSEQTLTWCPEWTNRPGLEWFEAYHEGQDIFKPHWQVPVYR